MAEGGKKELLRQIPRVKLWLVLVLTLAFSGVLLVGAHLTHSLTLRVEAYHGLYNVLTLCGCLLTMKVSSGPQSLHNTFGWARLEVLSMLTTLLFFTALCFSVTIESVQTALHVGHQDAMHHPLPVLALGGVGLALNALVFFLIGGYTHHQGCFLEMRDSGSVWVGRQVTEEAVQAGRRTLSSRDCIAGGNRPQKARQRFKEVVRDTCGLVIMEVCAAFVHWDNGGSVALYIDPALAVTSAALLIWLSLPYGKECCHILLQTIPGHIDVELFQRRVMKEFPALVNIHHLHIWTFTPSKVVATAHVVFPSTRVYLATKAPLREFFLDEGITQVTIQPEYPSTQASGEPEEDASACLLRCKQEQCHERECCFSCAPQPLLTSITSSSSSSSSPSQGARRRVTPTGDGGGGGDGVSDGGEAAARLGNSPAESDSGGDGGGGTKEAEESQENTMGTTDETPTPPAPEIPPTTTPPPSPISVSKLTITTTTTQPQEGQGGTSENTTEYYAVYSTYAEEDGTHEPLLRTSPNQDTPSHRSSVEQDGAGGNSNRRDTVEEQTERTCLLPRHNT